MAPHLPKLGKTTIYCKGFGFTAPDQGSQDMFVHISAVKVSFEIVADRRTGKSAAENLRAA
jgi:cold shock protein